MIRDWIRLKIEREANVVWNRTHPLEVQMYLDC